MALTPEEIDGLRELILSIYCPIGEDLLRDLCRSIAAAGQVTSSAEYKLLLAKSLAGADDVIADTLRRQTDLTDDAVEQLMRWAAAKTGPLEENESLRNIAEAYVKVTRKEVANVLGQLAAADVDGRVYPIKDVYRRTMDYVFRQVSGGAKTPEEAVRRATLQLWQRGIRTIERSDGRSFSIEYMAQRAIMAKMGEMTTAINEKHHEDGGFDGWEISAHSACAPDHEPIQGRQYSDKDYKLLNSRLQRRIGTLSCKHFAWPIKLGVHSPQWTEKQLAEMAQENAEGVTYEGRHYTQYEATQQQKALENSIRQCKDRIAAAQEEGKLGSGELRSSRILLRQLNAEYERFSAAAGLPTAPERLRAAGLGRALKADGILEMPVFSSSPRTSEVEQVDRLKERLTRQLTVLTQEEKEALTRYTGFDATRINSAIYQGKITESIRRKIEVLDAALARGTIPQKITVYKKTVLSHLPGSLPRNATLSQLEDMIGISGSFQGYLSTSFQELELLGRNTVLTLHVPAGYKGALYICSIATPKYRYQDEVLFARGLKYTITDATIKENTYYIEMEVHLR